MTPAAVTADHNPLRDPRDRRLPRIAGPCGLVIFGVTGDLARKKLMPAVYDLTNRGLLPPGLRAHRVRPARLGDAGLRRGRARLGEEVRPHRVPRGDLEPARRGHPVRPGRVRRRRRVRAARGHRLRPRRRARHGRQPRLLPVGPAERVPGGLPPARAVRAVPVQAGRLAPGRHREAVRPRPGQRPALNDVVSEVFAPDDVFRIDHYLGKETVQNLLALRFANQLYEPIWNANYVDHVQITMAEDIGIGGRAGYYDGIGAARDVIQNHLLQLLALTAMEEPVSFDATDLRAEKIKALSAVRLPKDLGLHTVPRAVHRRAGRAARRSSGTSRRRASRRRSTTETFAAIRLDIDTRRWAGVPFYLRTGKRLGRRVTEIAVVFKRAPHLPFESTATEELGKNALVIRVQPDEGVTLRFGAKVPGHRDGGPGRHDGLRLRPRVHRGLARGLRAPHPRRPARRPAAVPAARGGRALLEDPRPDRGVLGRQGRARPVPRRHLGTARRPTR